MNTVPNAAGVTTPCDVTFAISESVVVQLVLRSLTTAPVGPSRPGRNRTTSYRVMVNESGMCTVTTRHCAVTNAPPETPLTVAMTAAVPARRAVMSPVESTERTDVSVVFQVILGLVTVCELLSVTNTCRRIVSPTSTESLCGTTPTDRIPGGPGGGNPPGPVASRQVSVIARSGMRRARRIGTELRIPRGHRLPDGTLHLETTIRSGGLAA